MKAIWAFSGLYFFGTFYYRIGGLPVDSFLYSSILAVAALACAFFVRLAFQASPEQCDPAPAARLAAWIALGLLPIHWLGMRFHAHVGASKGHAESAAPLLAGLAVAALLWGGLAFGRRWASAARVGPLAAMALLAAYTLTTTLGDFSNMFDVMRNASTSLLDGRQPYAEPMPGFGLRPLYLPGQWLPYVPAYALGVDPRWLNLVYWAGAAALLLGALRGRTKEWAAVLLVAFFANPWLAFRHDNYQAALALPLAVALAARSAGYKGWEGMAWGWGAAASPFFWPAAAVMAAWQFGLRGALRWYLGVIAGVALVAGPFLALDAYGVYDGVFGDWNRYNVAPAIHFSLSRMLPNIGILTALQPLALGTCMLWAWRSRGRESTAWLAAAVAQGAFVLLLFHTDHYYWSLPLLTLTIAWLRRGAD